MPLQIVRVDSVRHAAAVLAAEDGARFVGGGTLVVRDVNAGDTAIDMLVLPDGLGLDRIAVDAGSVAIGASVSMAKIEREPALAFLKPVAGSIGGPAIRAMATVGGNLFAPYPHGDFGVALLALGAAATIEDLDESRTVGLEDFFGDRQRTTRGIVRDLRFALPPAGAFRFAKIVRRRPHGASVLSIAALLPLRDGKVSDARIAYGAMAATPIRARAVEAAIEGGALDRATIDAATRVAADGCAPLSDPQASDWYRLNVLPVHLARLLAA
jgi:CO/xanthine dehydrogenase FAD-binding subunit